VYDLDSPNQIITNPIDPLLIQLHPYLMLEIEIGLAPTFYKKARNRSCPTIASLPYWRCDYGTKIVAQMLGFSVNDLTPAKPNRQFVF
jgi:hypothetical protein